MIDDVSDVHRGIGHMSRAVARMLSLAVALGPFAGLAAGCSGSQDIPLAKVPDPPKLPAQDKTKLKPPSGSSPDVLPSQ